MDPTTLVPNLSMGMAQALSQMLTQTGVQMVSAQMEAMLEAYQAYWACIGQQIPPTVPSR